MTGPIRHGKRSNQGACEVESGRVYVCREDVSAEIWGLGQVGREDIREGRDDEYGNGRCRMDDDRLERLRANAERRSM